MAHRVRNYVNIILKIIYKINGGYSKLVQNNKQNKV